MRDKYRWSVTYRRADVRSARQYRRTVTATSPDEAREYVAILDPLYSSTVRVRRMRLVEEVAP